MTTQNEQKAFALRLSSFLPIINITSCLFCLLLIITGLDSQVYAISCPKFRLIYGSNKTEIALHNTIENYDNLPFISCAVIFCEIFTTFEEGSVARKDGWLVGYSTSPLGSKTAKRNFYFL